MDLELGLSGKKESGKAESDEGEVNDEVHGSPDQEGPDWGYLIVEYCDEQVIVARDIPHLKKARRDMRREGVDPDREMVGYLMEEIEALHRAGVQGESLRMIHEGKRVMRGKVEKAVPDDGTIKNRRDQRYAENAKLRDSIKERKEKYSKGLVRTRYKKKSGARKKDEKACTMCRAYLIPLYTCRVCRKRVCGHLCGFLRNDPDLGHSGVCANCQITKGLLEDRECPVCMGLYKAAHGKTCPECRGQIRGDR